MFWHFSDDKLDMCRVRKLFSIISIILYSCIAFAGAPNYTTFQTKIMAPSGLPLENPAVNFRFTILDSFGTCVLYIEDYVAVNMSGSGGVVSFSLGTGTKSYPGTATLMSEVFNNSMTVPYSCQAGGTYAPGLNDRRQIVMQFNDGGGWQTLPQMAINSVFYANYATTSEKLGNYVATDYLRPATLPSCIAGQALHFNGTSFTCVVASGGATGVTSLNVNSPLTIVNTTTTPVISLPKATGAVSGYLSSADWAVFNAKASATLLAGNFYVGNGSNAAAGVALSGDATLNSSGDLTLKNSGVSAGTYGSASSVAAITVDAKGRVTSVTSTPYQNATGAAKGVVQVGSNISVAAGVISLTSNDVTNALGYTPPNGLQVYVQNGNSFSANANVGTADNYNLNFFTSGTPKMTVLVNGNVGIGTTTPAGILDVQGGTSTAAGFGINLKAQNAVQSGPTSYHGGDVNIAGGDGFVYGGSGQVAISAGSDGNGAGPASLVLASVGYQSAGTATLTGGNGWNGLGSVTIQGGSAPSAGHVLLNPTAGNVGIGTTAPAAKLQVAGEAIIGESGLTCSVTTKGAIRYNNASSVLEFCNGSSWNLVQAAACSDATPNSFTFSDQSNQTPSTQTTSDIVQVSGFNCTVPVTVSGVGSPQIQICSDAGCATVIQGWTSSPSSIVTGQYLQMRQTSDAAGGANSQATVIIGGTASIWSVSTAGGDCVGTTPPVGTVCADGTIYAGLSPDTSAKMFTTRCDYGQTWNGAACTGTRIPQNWNNGTASYPATGYTNYSTGKANSAGLFASADAGAPYAAATACENLNQDGHSDWYLPAEGELNVLYVGRNTIRNFDQSYIWYWSSSEQNSTWVRTMRFADGAVDVFNGSPNKNAGNYLLRCVRR